MSKLKILAVILTCLTLAACGGNSTMLKTHGGQEIEFPNGTVLGGASADQARALAEILVDSHNQHMQATDEIKDLQNKNLATAEKALRLIQEVAKQQGSGEITIFFKTNSSAIEKNSLEYKRLIDFTDYVSRESHGRLVHFVTVGSASATGPTDFNEKLSQDRAAAPVEIIDHYLVNVPHDFHRVGGVGDMYSPQDKEQKINQRYQHVRVIAFYQTEQLPELPPELL